MRDILQLSEKLHNFDGILSFVFCIGALLGTDDTAPRGGKAQPASAALSEHNAAEAGCGRCASCQKQGIVLEKAPASATTQLSFLQNVAPDRIVDVPC